MDDDSGWNQILVEGWGELVRAAVCDRVEDALDTARGVLSIAATTPDDAPATAVERVHDAVVAAIAVETGANLDDLGSQAAWATYDDTWAELGRRCSEAPSSMELVREDAVGELVPLLRALPPVAAEHAGAVVDGADVRLVRSSAGAYLDVEGLFRWLATAADEDGDARQRARQLIAIARRRR